MAITTYASLLTAIAAWIDRDDLSDRIPEFIQLAEADINAVFDLRTVESDAALTGVVGSRTIPLPTGFREAQNLWITVGTERVPLRAVTPELIAVSTNNAQPVAWCVDGTNIAFDCPCDEAYSFTLRMTGGLSLESTGTNLVLTNYPNVYLFGALKEAAPFLRDAEAMQMFEGKYADAIAKAKAKEARAKALTTLSTEVGSLTSFAERAGYNINRGW